MHVEQCSFEQQNVSYTVTALEIRYLLFEHFLLHPVSSSRTSWVSTRKAPMRLFLVAFSRGLHSPERSILLCKYLLLPIVFYLGR